MKLDNKLLKEMIAEALEEASQYADQMSRDAQREKDDKKRNKEEENKKRVNVSGGREIDPDNLKEAISDEEVKNAEKEANVATAAAAAAEEEVATLKRDKADQELQKESFQLTKGRLRQIIREELISAKKQGLL